MRELKCEALNILTKVYGRTPHGVRGLKYKSEGENADILCRTPHGVRELKLVSALVVFNIEPGRTPHGVRGLKYIA